MRAARILIGLVALVILCGPICTIPIAYASVTTKDCHSKPIEQKNQSGIHACCQTGLLPSADFSPPEWTASIFGVNSSSEQFAAGHSEAYFPSFLNPTPREHASTFTILRI
jgi:hypothetical protein